MLTKIKNDILNKCGSVFKIRINSIRNKTECIEGCISEVYDRVFIVDAVNGSRLSFSYSDVLTGIVEIQDKIC